MKKRWKVLCCALLAGSLCACGSAGDEGEDREVTLILDYVPNTNHTGIYVAQEKGYFEEEGITLNIVEPGNDQTSATLVGAGRGEFGVSYQEDVTYARTAEDPLPIRTRSPSSATAETALHRWKAMSTSNGSLRAGTTSRRRWLALS